MCATTCYLIGAGRLREAERLTRQAIELGTKPGGHLVPEVGWPSIFQAEIMREWNQLDIALERVLQAIALCKQTEAVSSLAFLLCGYAVLMRVHLSRGELDAARSALEQLDYVGAKMNPHFYLHLRSLFTTIDQVRLWLAAGDLEHAVRWARKLKVEERHGTPFACEREEVAGIRILLAQSQPTLALEYLEPLLTRATAARRWDHVIELRLLQALAYQMHQELNEALKTLAEAVRLAEPEGYIRRFVDEGLPVETLLARLREQERRQGPTPYLDTVLAAFAVSPRRDQAETRHAGGSGQHPGHELASVLLEPLSERELEVLRLLEQGASNQEIAEMLVLAAATVKRHLSNIYSKLGVSNRTHAVAQARALGLLSDAPDTPIRLS